MGNITSLPLDFNIFNHLNLHHHHAHHHATAFAKVKNTSFDQAELDTDKYDPEKYHFDPNKPAARETDCCCTEIPIEKAPPAGEVTLVPKGSMLYHDFDYAHATNSCDSGTHAEIHALDSTKSYWCAPAFQRNDNGGYDPDMVSFTAGVAGETGRFPSYGVQIDFKHLPGWLVGLRVQHAKDGPWESMIEPQDLSRIFPHGTDSGSVWIKFPYQMNVHEIELGLKGSLRHYASPNGGTMAIQRVELLGTNPAGQLTQQNYDFDVAKIASQNAGTTQQYEVGIATGKYTAADQPKPNVHRPAVMHAMHGHQPIPGQASPVPAHSVQQMQNSQLAQLPANMTKDYGM
eukprot:gene351-706_t